MLPVCDGCSHRSRSRKRLQTWSVLDIACICCVAVNVSGNWCLVFRFVGTDVELVDYLDYH